MGTGIVTLSNVTAVYEGERIPALHHVSLVAEREEMVAVVGPNGAGKTTLLEVINGLLPITAGSVQVLGEPITQGSHHLRRQIAYLPQDMFFPPETPFLARDVVLMGRYATIGPFRRSRREDRQLATDALRSVGADALSRRPIGRLSGGQQRKVLLARVIARQPRLLLLDEPLTNLDPEAKDDLSRLILDIHSELGLTTLFVSHESGLLLTAVDRKITIVAGRVVASSIGEPLLVEAQ